MFLWEKSEYTADHPLGIFLFIFYGLVVISLIVICKLIRVYSSIIFGILMLMTILLLFYICNALEHEDPGYIFNFRFFSINYFCVSLSVLVSSFMPKSILRLIIGLIIHSIIYIVLYFTGVIVWPYGSGPILEIILTILIIVIP